MPEGAHLGQDYCAEHSTSISLSGINVVAGLALVVLIVIARHTSATAVREFGKTNKQMFYS